MYLHEEQKQKKWRQNLIWYYPDYEYNLKTNAGKIFLKLLKKHFPKSYLFPNTFNKKTVKLNYISTRNIARVITSFSQNVSNLHIENLVLSKLPTTDPPTH